MVDPRSISYIPNWFSVHDSPRSATRTVDSHAYGFAAAADRLILAQSIASTKNMAIGGRSANMITGIQNVFCDMRDGPTDVGRQIHFHMLDEDLKSFLRIVADRDPVTVTLRDADSSEIRPFVEPADGKTLSLWNRDLLANLQREWIPGPDYFRIDTRRTPTLELMPSLKAEWQGKPALVQGRLYGHFDSTLNKPREFEQWYGFLVNWIRRHFAKAPKSVGGYVGAAAHQFYENGGYLLPQFLPPVTDVWLRELGEQHSPSH